MSIPEIPPFRGPDSRGSTPTSLRSKPLPSPSLHTSQQLQAHLPPMHTQKPLPSLASQQALPSLTGQKPLPSSPFAPVSPAKPARPDSGSSNDLFGGPLHPRQHAPPPPARNGSQTSIKSNLAPPPSVNQARNSFGRIKPQPTDLAFLNPPSSSQPEITALTGVVVPALEAALAAATLRFEHDPEGSIAEQARLRERLLALEARLKRFGRKRAATARQPNSAPPAPAVEAPATD